MQKWVNKITGALRRFWVNWVPLVWAQFTFEKEKNAMTKKVI